MNQVAVIETDAVVATMCRARAALAEAKTIQQTKRIVDAAAAAEIYARRQKLGEEASDLALSIKVEALRKLGEMLHAAPKAAVRLNGKNFDGTKSEPSKNDAPTLADLGLTKKESAVAQKLAALPEAEFAQVRDGHVTVAKAIAAVEATKPEPKPAAPKAKTARELEAERIAEEAHGGDDLATMLEEQQQEIDELRGLLAAADADDQKAEALKWRRMYDNAARQQSEAMDRAAEAVEREAWTMRQLRRCGKAVGETDPSKIAATVEGLMRARVAA